MPRPKVNVPSELDAVTEASVKEQEPVMVSKEEVDKLVADAVAKALAETAAATKSMEEVAAPSLIDAQKQKQDVFHQYMYDERVDMYLSPTYRPYFGNVMPVTINGVTIEFPVDGSTHSIPKTFADEIANRRVLIDKINFKTERMSDVQSNFEYVPGDLELI